jgi:hypothetical protein
MICDRERKAYSQDLVSTIRKVTETTQTNQQDIRTGLTNS